MRRTRGFSLLEVAVVIVLASLVGLGTMSLLRTIHETNARTRATSAAMAESQRTLETVLSMTAATGSGAQFDSILKAPGSPFAVGTVNTSADLSTGGEWTATTTLPGGMKRALTLGRTGSDPVGLLTLTIAITFTVSGQPKTVTLTSKVMR